MRLFYRTLVNGADSFKEMPRAQRCWTVRKGRLDCNRWIKIGYDDNKYIIERS